MSAFGMIVNAWPNALGLLVAFNLEGTLGKVRDNPQEGYAYRREVRALGSVGASSLLEVLVERQGYVCGKC